MLVVRSRWLTENPIAESAGEKVDQSSVVPVMSTQKRSLGDTSVPSVGFFKCGVCAPLRF